jgi:hypothetical protein
VTRRGCRKRADAHAQLARWTASRRRTNAFGAIVTAAKNEPRGAHGASLRAIGTIGKGVAPRSETDAPPRLAAHAHPQLHARCSALQSERDASRAHHRDARDPHRNAPRPPHGTWACGLRPQAARRRSERVGGGTTARGSTDVSTAFQLGKIRLAGEVLYV